MGISRRRTRSHYDHYRYRRWLQICITIQGKRRERRAYLGPVSVSVRSGLSLSSSRSQPAHTHSRPGITLCQDRQRRCRQDSACEFPAGNWVAGCTHRYANKNAGQQVRDQVRVAFEGYPLKESWRKFPLKEGL